MILYKAIRYTILDMCIESLFNALYKNLSPKIKGIFGLAIGRKFSIIKISFDREDFAYRNAEYYNCTITHINQHGNKICFDYESGVGISRKMRTVKMDSGTFYFAEIDSCRVWE